MIILMVLGQVSSQYNVARDNPLEVLTNHLGVRKVVGCEGDTVNISCDSDYKVSLTLLHDYHENKNTMGVGVMTLTTLVEIM